MPCSLQGRQLTAEQSAAAREEMADGLLYLIRLADKVESPQQSEQRSVEEFLA
jgi:hypothetical protein